MKKDDGKKLVGSMQLYADSGGAHMTVIDDLPEVCDK